MQSFNRISSAIFDVLMAPFGHDAPWWDLVVWPLLLGVMAILVYKAVSNQEGLARVKSQIAMRLLEIRLFNHDIVQVLKSTGIILVRNVVYLGNHMVPMAVMILPFMAIMAQLVAHYAYEPSPRGAVELLHARLDPALASEHPDVSLSLPEGVTLDAPPVRTADGQVFWRLRAEQEGDHVLQVAVGEQRYEKAWAVGGDARKVPVKRLRGWEAFLYPGEEALTSDASLLSLELEPHARPLGFLPPGELGVVLLTLVVSLAAGFLVKGVFGVTI